MVFLSCLLLLNVDTNSVWATGSFAYLYFKPSPNVYMVTRNEKQNFCFMSPNVFVSLPSGKVGGEGPRE